MLYEPKTWCTRRLTGLTFVTYLSHLRIEKAKLLLYNKELRVSEIAYEVGFQSLTHFNRIFHKLVGHSPPGVSERRMSTRPERQTDFMFRQILDSRA